MTEAPQPRRRPAAPDTSATRPMAKADMIEGLAKGMAVLESFDPSASA